MIYAIDHDCHIHSHLSACSGDPKQTSERILDYAVENGLKTIALTDHFWDETVEGASAWYAPQNYAHVREALPLPRHEGVRFLFGCETELDRHLTLGISRARMEDFDFIIIPITHMHMNGYTIERDANVARRTELWVERFRAVLMMDLPFERIGMAHLTCPLMAPDRTPEQHKELLRLLPEREMREVFTLAAKRGVGIELNMTYSSYDEERAALSLRPFKIAAECGCKFYLGSDAHTPDRLFTAPNDFRLMTEALALTEAQKHPLFA